jgi:hypothetical protein
MASKSNAKKQSVPASEAARKTDKDTDNFLVTVGYMNP